MTPANTQKADVATHARMQRAASDAVWDIDLGQTSLLEIEWLIDRIDFGEGSRQCR